MRENSIVKEAKNRHFVKISEGLEQFGINEPIMLKVSAKPITTVQGFDEHIPESVYLKINRVPVKEGDRVKPLRSAQLLLGLPMSAYNENREEYVLQAITKALRDTHKLLRKEKED
jgi:hypothetical protein